MTEMQLLEAIGMLDETVIADAETVKAPPRGLWVRRVTAMAACAVLLLGGAIVAAVGGMSNEGAYGDATGTPAGTTTTPGYMWGSGMAESTSDFGASSPEATSAGAPITTTTPAMTATTAGGIAGDEPLYYLEAFDGYADSSDSDQILSSLGWEPMTFQTLSLSATPSTRFEIVGGRLSFAATADNGVYALPLPEINRNEGYTLEFDLTYTSKEGGLAILSELVIRDGYSSYDLFELSPVGNAVYENYSKGQPGISGLAAPNIVEKGLLDLSGDLVGTTVTVRIEMMPEQSNRFYFKTATMTDFTEADVPDPPYPHMTAGGELALLFYGNTAGYLDNIRIY